MSPNNSAGRIPLLDAWRGTAVVVMFFWHLAWDLGMAGVFPLEKMFGTLATTVRYYIVFSFLLLSGISSRFSRSNARRGAITLALGLVITAVTYLAGDPAWFGILHLLGCCQLLYALLGRRLQKLPEDALLWGSLALFAVLLPILTRVRVTVPGLWLIGLRTRTFSSSDYYPLLPWGLLFLAGTALGGKILRSDAAWKTRKAWPPLCWIGRHALWIYLIHQPVLFVLVGLLTGYFPWQ